MAMLLQRCPFAKEQCDRKSLDYSGLRCLDCSHEVQIEPKPQSFHEAIKHVVLTTLDRAVLLGHRAR